jgi:hypothetical protein
LRAACQQFFEGGGFDRLYNQHDLLVTASAKRYLGIDDRLASNVAAALALNSDKYYDSATCVAAEEDGML